MEQHAPGVHDSIERFHGVKSVGGALVREKAWRRIMIMHYQRPAGQKPAGLADIELESTGAVPRLRQAVRLPKCQSRASLQGKQTN